MGVHQAPQPAHADAQHRGGPAKTIAPQPLDRRLRGGGASALPRPQPDRPHLGHLVARHPPVADRVQATWTGASATHVCATTRGRSVPCRCQGVPPHAGHVVGRGLRTCTVHPVAVSRTAVTGSRANPNTVANAALCYSIAGAPSFVDVS